MKTYEDVAFEYAKENGFDDWEQFDHPSEYREVAKRYAIEVARESLKNASENVKMKTKGNINDLDMLDDWSEIDKSTILSEDNLPKEVRS